MLRSNGIRSIESAFSHCSQLESLDLSRNQLTILPPLHLSLGNVTVLCLSQNEIAHTTGLERLFCLVELDLRDNFIRDLREVRGLHRFIDDTLFFYREGQCAAK
jgi:Leucine-rich repeat (LRR) protein